MKAKITLLLTVMLAAFSVALHAAEKNDSTRNNFFSAFDELKAMLEGKQTTSFERAVFISENPFHNNKYSYSAFQKSLDLHLFFIERLATANNHSDTMNFVAKVKANGRFNIDEIIYTPEEKQQLYDNAANNWAIFTYITDTIGIGPFYHPSFNYSTEDPFGIKDWSNSQLINLLSSKEQKGNCYALTTFFKIIADRLNTGAILCTAPQHIYIQHQDNKGDYYNVELATAGHPGDGMLQTLTYTTSSAIVNGISLRSYDDRQSIGLCMVNLAKAYEHKFNTKDDDFLLQCAETVLQNDSLNLNALLLKHQVLNERMLKHISENRTTVLGKLIQDKTVSKTFYELEKHLARLNRLGYIQMPMDVQQMVLNGFQLKEGEKFVDRNPKPFTIEGVPEEDNKYLTLTGGLFQEVFEPKKFEEYGQFTFDTETKTIAAIDTSKKNVFLIDPVAFAYDFGARIYDARLGRFLSIDPLARKYAGWSPYAFCANNPILNIDMDGKEIFLYHAADFDEKGQTVYTAGEVSQKTENVLIDMMKTSEGLAFLSQFAKEGQTIAGHTFTENGSLSNHDLIITDFSYENTDLNAPLAAIDGDFGASYNSDKNNLRFDLRLITKGESEEDVAASYTHESKLHGGQIKKFTNAFKLGGQLAFKKAETEENKTNYKGSQDHKDLKNQNSNSEGYKQYSKQRDQLIKSNPKYKAAFDKAAKEAQTTY